MSFLLVVPELGGLPALTRGMQHNQNPKCYQAPLQFNIFFRVGPLSLLVPQTPALKRVTNHPNTTERRNCVSRPPPSPPPAPSPPQYKNYARSPMTSVHRLPPDAPDNHSPLDSSTLPPPHTTTTTTTQWPSSPPP